MLDHWSIHETHSHISCTQCSSTIIVSLVSCYHPPRRTVRDPLPEIRRFWHRHNPYSLTLISINGHLHIPLIRLVDMRRSSPFFSSPQPPFYSTYSAISMAHTHVLRENWKSLSLLNYETISWLVIGVVHDESILVWRKWNMTKLYDFVGMNFLCHVILRRHNCLVSVLEVLLFFMSIWTFILNHLDLNIHATIKKNYIENYGW